MIAIIKKRGITINEFEEKKATKLLKRINYYRFTVFERYLDKQCSYTSVEKLYMFDKFLREEVNALIYPLEIFIKTSLAYYFTNYYEEIIQKIEHVNSEKKGDKRKELSSKKVPPSLAYLDINLYKKSKRNVNQMLSNFCQDIYDKQETDPSIMHHVIHYDGNIPMWVLFEHLTFGQVGTFVKYLDNTPLKLWTSNNLKWVRSNDVKTWIDTIRIIRNTVAHSSRIYGSYFNYSPSLRDEDKSDVGYHDMSDERKNNLIHTFFIGLLIMKNFYVDLSKSDKKNWNQFLYQVEDHINKNSEINKEEIGFPDNWLKILEII